MARAVSHGATGAGSLEELVAALEPPRHVWVTAPAGEPTRQTIDRLAERGLEVHYCMAGGSEEAVA